MKWFKRRYEDGNPGKDKVAKGIAGFIIKVQTGFARFMNKQAGKISFSSIKMLLVVFLLSGSALSIYFIAAAIIEKKQLKAVKVNRLSIPKYYNEDGAHAVQGDPLITKQEHAKMQAFKNYMDSLQQTKAGKIIYDNIMLHRPGLMDSINQLEKLYQSQNKK